MKIRSITYFTNPGWPLDEKILRGAGAFLGEARSAFEAAEFEVQTTRLATDPFPHLLGADRIDQLPELASRLGASIKEVGVAYASLGPALPEMPRSYAVIPEAISAAQDVFFSGIMADDREGVSLDAVRACADAIVACGPLTPDGFANLRFAALANVPPGSPFFPAAYHDGGPAVFALAIEAADLAVEAFSESSTVEQGRRALIAALEAHATRLASAAGDLVPRFGVRFGGIDFSLAPFPEQSRSLGAAMERTGVPRVGLHGSLAAAAILTDAIDRAVFPHTGFCGLMLPVLEDAVLAGRAAEGVLTVKDVLLYSAVCGTGLDTVPLPGDTTSPEIAALLLDLSALALRLGKPLTARLMPIPGKRAGEPTGFDFAFFANSRVMALQAEALRGPFSAPGRFELTPRKR